jgi:hypothetical protein
MSQRRCSKVALTSTNNYDPEFQETKESEESKFKISDDDSGAPINDDFTIDELNHAIETAKCTTPGEDGIGTSILKRLPMMTRKILLVIFNIIWLRGECPSKWKEAILTPGRILLIHSPIDQLH